MQSDLDHYRDHHRLIVLFAPSARDPRYARQDRLLRGETLGMRERDLLRIAVFPRLTTVDGRRSTLDPAALRLRYGVKEGDFRLLLIGKDGGVKRTATKPVAPKGLFDQIDAMPMRQAEIRHRG